MDETFTIFFSRQSAPEIVTGLIGTPGMPLSYLILHVWLWAGDSPVWIQMCPIMFSTGAVWLAWHIGRGLFGRGAAICGAAFAAVSPLMVIQAHFIRYPAFMSFFGMLSLHSVFHILGLYDKEGVDARGGGPAGWVWPVLFMSEVCCLFLHYYAVYWVFALNAVFFLFGRRRGLALKWLAVQIASVGCFAFWLPYMFRTATGALSWAPDAGTVFRALVERKFFLFDLAAELFTGSFVSIHADDAGRILLKTSILILFGIAAMRIGKILFSGPSGAGKKYAVLIVALAVPLVSAFVMSSAADGLGFYSLYFAFLLPLPMLLIGDVIMRGGSRVLRMALFSATVVAMIPPLIHVLFVYSSGPNIADSMRAAKKSLQPGDVFLVQPQVTATIVRYYVDESATVVCLPVDFNIRKYQTDKIYVVLNKERFAAIRKKLDSAHRVWFVDVRSNFNFDPEGLAPAYLKNNFQRTKRLSFFESYPVRGILTLYIRTGHPAGSASKPDGGV